MNSVFTLRAASFSIPIPLDDSKESISSINIMLCSCFLAVTNKARTTFSDSPNHLELMDAAEMLKKVAESRTDVPTALANNVLPVPGAFEGDRIVV